MAGVLIREEIGGLLRRTHGLGVKCMTNGTYGTRPGLTGDGGIGGKYW